MSIREQVTEDIRTALLSGEFRPGATYTVRSLARQYGVSATPVREAILDLANEGLVAIRPNRGFTVAEQSAETVIGLVNVRRLLEIPATLEVCDRVGPDEIDRLMSAAVRTETMALAGDLRGYLRADQDFHRAVLGLTGNPVLVDLTERLRARARLHAVPSLVAAGELLASAREHVDLVAAVRDGDRGAVVAAVEHHIHHALRGAVAMSPVIS